MSKDENSPRTPGETYVDEMIKACTLAVRAADAKDEKAFDQHTRFIYRRRDKIAKVLDGLLEQINDSIQS